MAAATLPESHQYHEKGHLYIFQGDKSLSNHQAFWRNRRACGPPLTPRWLHYGILTLIWFSSKNRKWVRITFWSGVEAHGCLFCSSDNLGRNVTLSPRRRIEVQSLPESLGTSGFNYLNLNWHFPCKKFYAPKCCNLSIEIFPIIFQIMEFFHYVVR